MENRNHVAEKVAFDASASSLQINANRGNLDELPDGSSVNTPLMAIGTSRDSFPSIDPERIGLPDRVCCDRDDFEIDGTYYQVSTYGDANSNGGVSLNAWTSHAASAPLDALTSHGRQSLARRVSSW